MSYPITLCQCAPKSWLWNLLAHVQHIHRACSPPYGELPPYEGTGYLLCLHWHTFCWFCKMGEDLCQLPLCKVFVKVIVMNCSSNFEFESYRSIPLAKVLLHCLHVLYIVTITALYTVTLSSPCMHACQSAVPDQVTGGPSAATRSSQPPTQV